MNLKEEIIASCENSLELVTNKQLQKVWVKYEMANLIR